MWFSLLALGVPILAALSAIWGLWQRKWYAWLPAAALTIAAVIMTDVLGPLAWRAREFYWHVEPRNLIMAGLLADAAAVGCLAALWAGWSRAHWFWRLAPLVGVPAALALVHANEPIVLAIVVMPVIAAAAWWIRRQQDGAEVTGPARGFVWTLRWPLQDGFLAFVIVGLAALIARSLGSGSFFVSWENFATLAAALVLLSLTAATAGAACTAPCRRSSAAACAALVAAISVVLVVRDNDVLGMAYFIDQPRIDGVGPGLYLMAVLTTAILIGITAATFRWSSSQAGRQTAHLARAASILAAAAMVTPLFLAGAAMIPPRITARPLPPSMTYVRVQAAGEKAAAVRTVMVFDPQPIVAEAAAALQEPGNVWFNSADFRARELTGNFDPSFHHELMLSILLDGETAAAEQSSNVPAIFELSLLQWRLGRVLSRGGTRMNWLTSWRSERRGCAGICGVIDRMSDQQCRLALAELRRSLSDRPDSDDILAYDAYWNWEWFGWRQALYRAAHVLMREEPRRQLVSDEFLRETERFALTRWRLLESRLAIELHRRRHGEWPEKLAELIPAYLLQLPIDPFSGLPLVYRREGETFVLYSVGHDGRDDGGVFPWEGSPSDGKRPEDINWDCERRARWSVSGPALLP